MLNLLTAGDSWAKSWRKPHIIEATSKPDIFRTDTRGTGYFSIKKQPVPFFLLILSGIFNGHVEGLTGIAQTAKGYACLSKWRGRSLCGHKNPAFGGSPGRSPGRNQSRFFIRIFSAKNPH
jgi:hypothetical protein